MKKLMIYSSFLLYLVLSQNNLSALEKQKKDYGFTWAYTDFMVVIPGNVDQNYAQKQVSILSNIPDDTVGIVIDPIGSNLPPHQFHQYIQREDSHTSRVFNVALIEDYARKVIVVPSVDYLPRQIRNYFNDGNDFCTFKAWFKVGLCYSAKLAQQKWWVLKAFVKADTLVSNTNPKFSSQEWLVSNLRPLLIETEFLDRKFMNLGIYDIEECLLLDQTKEAWSRSSRSAISVKQYQDLHRLLFKTLKLFTKCARSHGRDEIVDQSLELEYELRLREYDAWFKGFRLVGDRKIELESDLDLSKLRGGILKENLDAQNRKVVTFIMKSLDEILR